MGTHYNHLAKAGADLMSTRDLCLMFLLLITTNNRLIRLICYLLGGGCSADVPLPKSIKKYSFVGYKHGFFHSLLNELHHVKTNISHGKTKAQISFTVTVKLISAFVFTTWIVRYQYNVLSKSEISSL